MRKFPEDLRVGDVVEIVIRSKVIGVNNAFAATEANSFRRDQDDILSVKVITIPIKVGEYVRMGTSSAKYTVLALDGDVAWIKSHDALATRISIQVSRLERA